MQDIALSICYAFVPTMTLMSFHFLHLSIFFGRLSTQGSINLWFTTLLMLSTLKGRPSGFKPLERTFIYELVMMGIYGVLWPCHDTIRKRQGMALLAGQCFKRQMEIEFLFLDVFALHLYLACEHRALVFNGDYLW